MLKELVQLIAAASETAGKLKELVQLIAAASETAGNGCKVERLQDCIDRAIEAVGKHDIEKRKTDEAICLLFRAVHEMNNDTDDAAKLLRRAEVLLGYVPLTPANG